MPQQIQALSPPLKSAANTSKIAQKLDQFSCKTKLTLARQQLEKLHLRFPHLVDAFVFRELDRIAANLEDDFIQKRNTHHLSRLAYSIGIIRKQLSQELSFLPLKSRYDIRLMPFSLHFAFGSKSILGVLAHACLKDKYEAFDEEHVLMKIKKLISEARLIKGSVYSLQPSNSAIKTLYFEIDKKSGLPFTVDEIKRLKTFLKQEVEHCVEKLIPCIFMARNEEEVLKNILTLSREIRKPSDAPEVMILLDPQTSQEAIFTVIALQVCNETSPNIFERFAKIQGHFTFFPERSQIVRYLKKKYPLEANVFRIHLPKDPSILRSDLSINFYLARQKVSSLLTQVIGDFRDFNGGIILKQREALCSFIELFPELALQNPDLLETFFYSINPIEAQAFLPTVSIKNLFTLFLAAQSVTLAKSSDYFLRFHQNDHELFFMIRLPDKNFKDSLQTILSHFLHSQIISSSLSLKNNLCLGYLITSVPSHVQEELKTSISQALSHWQRSIENQKILRLGFEYSVVSLDPRIGGDQVSSIILKMLFEGLMRENREGKIEYGVAKSVEISSDLKTYIFKLRPTYWSNGSTVTAFDFEYAWKKVLSPSFKTPFAYFFYPIKNAELAKSGALPPDALGIHALDEMTLKVELKYPSPSFLELTTHTIYSPVHRLTDQLHPNWPFEENNAYLCNGSFLLSKNNPNQGYELIKNPLYWDTENIQLDGVSILRMNRFQAFEKFQTRHNHWVGDPVSMWDPDFTCGVEDESVDSLSKSMYWYAFNCQKPPFNHKKMRQAFSFAIDRKTLAKAFHTQAAISPLPLGHSSIEQSSLSHFNPQLARTLFNEALEEMGWPKDTPLAITLIYSTGTIKAKLAQNIKRSWETTFDIQCSIEAVKWNSLFTRITEGHYQVGCIAWMPWINDPMYTFNAFRDSKEPVNFPKWSHVKYQEILHQAEQEKDLEKRHPYYLQAERLLLEELPVAPICLHPTQALKKKNLQIYSSSLFLNFKWARFESLQPIGSASGNLVPLDL